MFISEKLLLGEYYYPLAIQHNPKFESLILNQQKVNHISRCHAQMTERNMESDELIHLVSWIVNITQDNMVKPYEYISSSYNLQCHINWGIICNQGDNLEEHRHNPAQFSFVYYVKCPEGSSPLVFTTSGYEVKAKAGKLVVFDSGLLHKVPQNNCNDRYSFVGNLSAVR